MIDLVDSKLKKPFRVWEYYTYERAFCIKTGGRLFWENFRMGLYKG